MSRTRRNTKGRRDSGTFSKLIHAYFQSPEYAELSPRAVKALIDLYCQYNGFNNGDLCASWTAPAMGRNRIWPGMRARGWRSKDLLHKALKELLDRGWIVVTRQGGMHYATLYAVSFLGIDSCGNKLDVTPNPVPSHLWKAQNRSEITPVARSLRRVRKRLPARYSGRVVPLLGAIRETGLQYYPATRGNNQGFFRNGAPIPGHHLRVYQAAA